MTKQWHNFCHHLTAMMVPPDCFFLHRAWMQPVGPNLPRIVVLSTFNFRLLPCALPNFFASTFCFAGDVYLRCLSSVQEFITVGMIDGWSTPFQQDKMMDNRNGFYVGEVFGTFGMFFFTCDLSLISQSCHLEAGVYVGLCCLNRCFWPCFFIQGITPV